MIDAKRIEEMKRLTAEATPGPYYIDGAVDVHSAIGGEVASVWDGGATLEFIAESRQFVPDIITAYEEQAEEITRLRAENEKLRNLNKHTEHWTDIAYIDCDY